MINVTQSLMRDATKSVNADAVLVSGRPVSINTDGEIIAATDSTGVYGLSLVDKNAKRDDTFGEVGAYGSRKATVEVAGRAEVSPSVYLDVDLGEEITFDVYDPNQSYKPMDNLFVNSSGLLTNVNTGGQVVGQVVKAPTGSNPVMELVISSCKVGVVES